MKFIVFGSTRGDLDIVNTHLKNSDADFGICTGDIGILYRDIKNKFTPKSFKDNNFCDYLEGKKKFIKPVVSVRGVHDNFSLCKKIQDKKVKIENFSLINNGKSIIMNDISIGGIGGSYSEKYYNSDCPTNENKRYFLKKEVEELKKNKNLDVVVSYDLIGNCTKKAVRYSDATYSMIENINPYYLFVGKYHWWGYTKLPNTNIVVLPFADKGYLIVKDNWDVEGIRFDLEIGRK